MDQWSNIAPAAPVATKSVAVVAVSRPLATKIRSFASGKAPTPTSDCGQRWQAWYGMGCRQWTRAVQMHCASCRCGQWSIQGGVWWPNFRMGQARDDIKCVEKRVVAIAAIGSWQCCSQGAQNRPWFKIAMVAWWNRSCDLHLPTLNFKENPMSKGETVLNEAASTIHCVANYINV